MQLGQDPRSSGNEGGNGSEGQQLPIYTVGRIRAAPASALPGCVTNHRGDPHAWSSPVLGPGAEPCCPSMVSQPCPRPSPARTWAVPSISSRLSRSCTRHSSSCSARTVLATWASSSAASPGGLPVSPPASRTSAGTGTGTRVPGQAEHCPRSPGAGTAHPRLPPTGERQLPQGTCHGLPVPQLLPAQPGSPSSTQVVPRATHHCVPPVLWWWQWVATNRVHAVVCVDHLLKAGHPGPAPPCPPLGPKAPKQPSKHLDNPGCEWDTGRDSLPAPGDSPAWPDRPQDKFTAKVKQPRKEQ